MVARGSLLVVLAVAACAAMVVAVLPDEGHKGYDHEKLQRQGSRTALGAKGCESTVHAVPVPPSPPPPRAAVPCPAMP
eukprot:SAG22_NODE_3300_length_1795_cov_2.247642_3_plen_78_part_00